MRRLSYSVNALSARARTSARARPAYWIRIEHGVAPRLAVLVGPARRRAHAVAGQERRGVGPGVGVGVADLQIAVQREPVPGGLAADPRVLVVDEQLAERVALDRGRVLIEERGALRVRRRVVGQPQVAIGRRPVAEAGAAVRGAQGRVEGVAVEPAGVLGPERGEPGAQVGPPGQRGVRGLDQAVVRVVGAAVLGRSARGRQHGARELGVADQALERAAGAQRAEREVAEVAREDRPVVRRGVVARGLALRPELDPGEAERARVAEQPRGGAGRGAAAPGVLVGVGREARVVDREQHPPHAQPREALVDPVVPVRRGRRARRGHRSSLA